MLSEMFSFIGNYCHRKDMEESGKLMLRSPVLFHSTLSGAIKYMVALLGPLKKNFFFEVVLKLNSVRS